MERLDLAKDKVCLNHTCDVVWRLLTPLIVATPIVSSRILKSRHCLSR